MREYVRALIAPANSLYSPAATSRGAAGIRSALSRVAAGGLAGGGVVAVDAVGAAAVARDAGYPAVESTRFVVRRTESGRRMGTVGRVAGGVDG